MRKPFIPCSLAAIALALLASNLAAQDVTAILRRLDANEVYRTIQSDAELLIQYGGKRILKSFTMYARGGKDSFVEFTNPEDAGTKMLKKDGKLFLYSPDAEEVIPITGHLLKESLMGSDLSYEDTVANDTLESLYNAQILEQSSYEGKPCWVLELVGKRKTISYPKLKMWVAKDSYIPLKTERYALSGALLKEERVLETRILAGRIFPVKFEVRDLLRRDSRTLFTFTNTKLDEPIAESLFSMRNLQR